MVFTVQNFVPITLQCFRNTFGFPKNRNKKKAVTLKVMERATTRNWSLLKSSPELGKTRLIHFLFYCSLFMLLHLHALMCLNVGVDDYFMYDQIF